MKNSKDLVTKLLMKISSEIKSSKFREKHTTKNTFTRNRKMNFEQLSAFLINRSIKSYDGKLASLSGILTDDISESISKQAISKARSNISYDAFRELFLMSVDSFMEYEGRKKDWKGYQLYAIDGTDLDLPTSNEIKNHFGFARSRFGTETPKASATALFDVNNDVILDMTIEPYRTGERVMAKKLIEQFSEKYDITNSVLIFDRGYPSYEFLQYLDIKKIPFLMRVKSEYKNFVSYKDDDITVTRRYKRKDTMLRLVAVELETGMKEHLITNIHDQNITPADFYELYFFRWGVESKYRELKNRFQLEEFSGILQNSILQDFYINLLLSNICALIKSNVDEMIQQDIERKSLKGNYQANRSVIIERVNHYISEMILYPAKITEIINRLLELAYKKRSQIRSNRKYERNNNVNRRKHWMNNKSCL